MWIALIVISLYSDINYAKLNILASFVQIPAEAATTDSSELVPLDY